MRKTKSILNPNAVRIKQDPEGSGSGSLEDIISQESSVSARRFKEKLKEKLRMRSSVGGIIASASTSETSTSISQTSLTHSIDKFREDFDDFKCKMKIFGESLNLCKCIASDFKGKLSWMERRLQNLEKRQKLIRVEREDVGDATTYSFTRFLQNNESNYPAIIKKNKELSKKTLVDANKLKMCGTEEEMREVAGRICRNYLHGAWKTVDAKDLEFKKIVGGLSNFLYYVALPEDASKMNFMRTAREDDDKSNSFTLEEPKKVLLRIYGQVHGERAMDAIVTESVIFTLLSERRLGPKLYGVFSGGRIEEYIPARALLTKELSDPALSMKIAEKMAAIHSMDIPLSKEPNWLWKTMGKWLKTVKEERLGAATTKGKTEIEQQIIRRLKLIDYEKEIEWLKKLVASVESPVVFCHNDMQEGNILLLEDHVQNTNDDYVAPYDPNYDQTLIDKHIEEQSKLSLDEKEQNPNSSMIFMDSMSQFDDANTSDSHISDNGEPKLYIIDFEYCAYNYRGFDIANHFQEWAFDYTNPQHPYYYEIHENLPTLEQKEIFIKEYLKHYQTFLSDEKEPQASIEAVNKLLGEVEAFALVSHLFWSLWSVVNASKSQITFGYWEYALSRIESYLLLKQEYVKGNSSRNGQKRKICEVDI